MRRKIYFPNEIKIKSNFEMDCLNLKRFEKEMLNESFERLKNEQRI